MCRPSKSSCLESEKANETGDGVPHDHDYTVNYYSESHWSVLTQRLGSVWPKVIPYCVINVALMVVLRYLRDHGGETGRSLTGFLAIGKVGYKYVKFVMAFLIVTRVKMSLDRYNEARSNIGILYRESRELIQNAVVFTDYQRDDAAREWRHEMAYRTLILLRTCMAVLNFSVRKTPAWMLPEVNGREKDLVQRNLLIYPENAQYTFEENTEFEETMRVPVIVARLLSKTIQSQKKRLTKGLPLPQEMKLYGSVDSFMEGFYGLRKLLTTPVPFPLIQNARTFLFLFVFSIPFGMLSDDSCPAAHCFFVLLITMGFLGLETVAMELDNPFGDDPNDFNNLALAATANEDTYLTILDIDGRAQADLLRHRMRNHKRSEPALSEGSCLLHFPYSLEDCQWEKQGYLP